MCIFYKFLKQKYNHNIIQRFFVSYRVVFSQNPKSELMIDHVILAILDCGVNHRNLFLASSVKPDETSDRYNYRSAFPKLCFAETVVFSKI